jgi:hypothetical protein
MSVLLQFAAGVVPKLHQRRILRPNDAKAQITNVRFAPVAHILSRCRAPRIAPSWREMLHSLREKTPHRDKAGGWEEGKVQADEVGP